MEPLREPLRPMASVVETIILKRLLRMEEEQACRQTSLDHIIVSQVHSGELAPRAQGPPEHSERETYAYPLWAVVSPPESSR